MHYWLTGHLWCRERGIGGRQGAGEGCTAERVAEGRCESDWQGRPGQARAAQAEGQRRRGGAWQSSRPGPHGAQVQVATLHSTYRQMCLVLSLWKSLSP